MTQNNVIEIGLLGISFDTGNLGVNALAESSMKCILHRWPEARISLLAAGRYQRVYQLVISGRTVEVCEYPLSFSVNLFKPNHFLRVLAGVLLLRFLPGQRWKSRLLRTGSFLSALRRCTCAADITGGDSFSDIYGLKRFIMGFCRKKLVLLAKKKLILLPQTYGPFKSGIAHLLARQILTGASAIYSRDKEGLDEIRQVAGKCKLGIVPEFCPDVAFVLDKIKPGKINVLPDSFQKRAGMLLIGLNISGLLYNGGYTHDNMFGLACDYRVLIAELIRVLLRDERIQILLISHVFPNEQMAVESDPIACKIVYNQLHASCSSRLFCLEGKYNQGEIKYIIGQCDFFIGSRMHACIAALSQTIPAVGLAYSKKFKGVFESVDAADCVADTRRVNQQEIIALVMEKWKNRDAIQQRLKRAVPCVQEQILNIFSRFGNEK